MTSTHDLLPCPFVAGPKITDLRLFIGRKNELREIASRMNGIQPMSVNLTGERRIGKSSLLYAFTHLWDQYVPPETRRHEYVVVYLDLQESSPSTGRLYYQALLKALRERPVWNRFPDLQSALADCPPEEEAFDTFLHRCKERGFLPVICLDEFETLFRYPQAFNNSFFDIQRGYMNASVLMYIIATNRPLDHYRREQRLTSSFFNLGHVLRLGEFSDEEAADLARLPASTVPGAPAALSLDEQRRMREWGGRHPYLLQLAGYFLSQARQNGRDEAWAYEQFLAEKRRLPRRFSLKRMLSQALQFLWDLPLYLGRLAKGVRKNTDDLKDRLTGLALLLVLLLILLGILRVDLLRAWLEKFLGVTP
jgi:hypothetical protein